MKKRILALALCATAVLGLVACGKEKEQETTQTPVQEETVEMPEATDEQAPETFMKAVDVLDAVNVDFDSETLNYLGGGFGENITQGKPGDFPLDDAEVVRSTLTFPDNCLDMVDEAATMTHMMNSNLYTSAALHVKDVNNMLNVQEQILDTVKNNQWICGFPEKLVIGQVENYVVYAYGNVDLVDTFESGLRKESLAEVNFIEDLVMVDESETFDEYVETTDEVDIVEGTGTETVETTDATAETVESTEEATEAAETTEDATEATLEKAE